jgi:hypothetical protein
MNTNMKGNEYFRKLFVRFISLYLFSEATSGLPLFVFFLFSTQVTNILITLKMFRSNKLKNNEKNSFKN